GHVFGERDAAQLAVLATADIGGKRCLQVASLGVRARVALALLTVDAVGDHVGLATPIDARCGRSLQSALLLGGHYASPRGQPSRRRLARSLMTRNVAARPRMIAPVSPSSPSAK